VHRAVLIAFLALLTFNVSGLAALCGEEDCDGSCPSDVSGGQCAPNCHYCSCCSLPKVTASTSMTLDGPTPHASTWVGAIDRPSCPAPADIMHVPKFLLA